MSENRFQEQTPESLSLWPIMTVHCSLENGFVLIPCPGMDASPVIGIYQLAYESARNEVLAGQRAKRLHVSMN